jgi:hypothetical protein
METQEITNTFRQAMELAKLNPGRYGGRYVGRIYNRETKQDEYVICEDDDPKRFNEGGDLFNDKLDILAQCTPTKCYGIGRWRNFVNADGSVDFGE